MSTTGVSGGIRGGFKTVALAETPEPLVANSQPCQAVWVGAPCTDEDLPVNLKTVFIGDATRQNIPLRNDNAEGMIIPVRDASKLYVKVGVDAEEDVHAEGLEYQIIY